MRARFHLQRNECDAHAALVGVHLQESQLPDKITVVEALDLSASFYPRPADPGELLGRIGLTEQCRTRCRRVSGGQKQRLSIAVAPIGNRAS